MSTTTCHSPLWSNFINPDGTSPMRPGSLHLRVHQGGSSRSRVADLAGVAMWSADQRIPTTFLGISGHQGHEFAKMAGRGWHDPILRTEAVSGILDATAALYRLWTRTIALGAPSCVLALESLSEMSSGPLNDTVSDDTNLSWLGAALRSGTADVLGVTETIRALTGLDFGFHQGGLPATLPATCVVAGVMPRRGHIVGDMKSIRGTSQYLFMADTIVEYHSIGLDPAGPNAVAKVTTLKHRHRPTSEDMTVTVTRPLEGETWSGPTRV